MGLWSLLLDILMQIFSGPKSEQSVPDRIAKDLDPVLPKEPEEKKVDWNDLDSQISKYFKVKEAIWLPQWNRAATEADGLTEEVKKNLEETFKKMDMIREFIEKPIKVHIAFRSTEYNTLVKGAKSSAHLYGKAVDWSADLGQPSKGENCDKIKELLEPCLEEWNMRMEDNGKGATWVHNDTAPVISKRFFKP